MPRLSNKSQSLCQKCLILSSLTDKSQTGRFLQGFEASIFDRSSFLTKYIFFAKRKFYDGSWHSIWKLFHKYDFQN